MKLRPVYLAAAVILFAIEVVIALFVRDAFIRPYVGDVLAVMLVYFALRGVASLGIAPAIVITLAIAFAIEFAQLFRLLDALGLSGNQIARTVLGGAFDWLDLAAYAAGAAIIVVVEALLRPRAR